MGFPVPPPSPHWLKTFCFPQKSPSSVSRIFSARHSSLAQLVAQERLCHFSLPPPLPATREQTKALLQSVLADKRSQKLRLVALMRSATEQQTKRKRDCQAAKNSTGNQKLRFLNMDPKQVLRRYKRMKQREYRKALLQSKPRRPPSKATATKPVVRKARPCCGYFQRNCVCKPPPGMKKSHLAALCRRFGITTLSSVQDTTDVSTFQTLMTKRCERVPLRILLAYAHTHAVFNQDHLLRSFIKKKAFLFRPPWFNWRLLQSIVNKSKQTGQRCRSSNYRSTILQKIRLPSHIGKAHLLKSIDAVERDVLACRLVGEDAMPAACLDLYDKNPSRDLWKASMLSWLEQVHSKCSGCFDHYYLKCSLDRAFAVRKFNYATISWWPTECPAYQLWFKLLYSDKSLTTEEKFQVLCQTYLALNRTKNCSLPEALAQTCWVHREKNGTLRLIEDN